MLLLFFLCVLFIHFPFAFCHHLFKCNCGKISNFSQHFWFCFVRFFLTFFYHPFKQTFKSFTFFFLKINSHLFLFYYTFSLRVGRKSVGEKKLLLVTINFLTILKRKGIYLLNNTAKQSKENNNFRYKKFSFFHNDVQSLTMLSEILSDILSFSLAFLILSAFFLHA